MEGYKQTGIGMIPKDWLIVAFDQIKSTKDKWSIVGGPFGSSLKAVDYTPEGVRVIQLQNIGDGEFIDDNEIYTSTIKADELVANNIYPGDIILSKMGDPVARACIIPNRHNRYVMCSDGIRLNVDPINYNGKFVYYYLNSKSFRNRAISSSTGSTRLRIGLSDLKKLLVISPPIKEQTAIANALSDTDAWIQSLTRLIAKKRQIKQGAMHELLQPKKNWVRKRLGETATLKARIGWQGLTTAEYLEAGDFFLVTGTEFKNGYIDWDNCHCVEESRYKQDRNIQLKLNDILVTKDGTIGKVALINQINKPATLNSGVFVIRPNKNTFDPVFFYYVLSSKWFFEFLNQLSAGSTISHLYQKDFVNFIYQTPCNIEEQTEIATILSNMDVEIAALENKLVKAQQTKQGMMQNLLTGRIRLI